MQHLFPPWCLADEVILPCRPGHEAQYQFLMTSEIDRGDVFAISQYIYTLVYITIRLTYFVNTGQQNIKKESKLVIEILGKIYHDSCVKRHHEYAFYIDRIFFLLSMSQCFSIYHNENDLKCIRQPNHFRSI